MEFDHAGVATDEFDALVDLYGAVFDAPLVHEEEFEGLRVGFLDLGNGYFEVLEPLDDEGTIAGYLDRQGPGLHHVALRTGDVAAALDIARREGLALVDEEPRRGAWGHDVAFLHPDSTGGVLVEFVEH
ncbi:methylmalonyl-CoA epimerase [Halobacteriales archaeon QS_4_69_31]|jgi:methylmalonyl-CoA/ethylmalonyl-CoA epimerase|nr:MAG: methylmalonyl-CoA epimerase [Halobacteriales archaeon QS_4_69_31]